MAVPSVMDPVLLNILPVSDTAPSFVDDICSGLSPVFITHELRALTVNQSVKYPSLCPSAQCLTWSFVYVRHCGSLRCCGGIVYLDVNGCRAIVAWQHF